MHAGKQFIAFDAWHNLVGDHQRDVISRQRHFFEQLDCIFSIVGGFDNILAAKAFIEFPFE